MKALNLGLLVLLLLTSCDSQSPNAKFVDEEGMSISLVKPDSWPDLPLSSLDAWWAGNDGADIYGGAFKYKCTITTEIEADGIKVLCYVTQHRDPMGGDYDIWDRLAPNGEPYGYVASEPAGSWDYEEGKAVARISGRECVFFIGLGSPYPDTIPDYDWPKYCEGGDTPVDTLVEVKFVIPKWNGNIEKECYMRFVRVQCQNFWEPLGGVIGSSYSTLVKYQEGMYSMSAEGVTIQLERVEQTDVVGYTPKTKVKKVETETADPSIREWKPPTTRPPSLTNPILPFALTAEVSEPWEYIEGNWQQYKLGWWWTGHWWYGWNFVSAGEDLVVLWMADPCDYQDGVGLVSYAHPYAFFCKVAFYMEDEVVDVIFTHIHTLILKSKDEFGNDAVDEFGNAVWLPINMYVYDIEWPYCHYIYLWSTGIVAVEHTAGQGYYRDYWGYPFALIYVPDNGYLEIKVDDFYGDFNFDGRVNFVDLAMLLNYMDKGLTDEYYNLMYDADHDGQTDANDLAIFFQNWLKTR